MYIINQSLPCLAVLLLSGLLGCCLADTDQPNASMAMAHPTRVLVKLTGIGPSVYTTRPVRPGETALEAIARVQKQPGVEYVEPDFAVKGLESPNDPDYAQQWGLVNANADCAWSKMANITKTIPVCVVDSGVQYDHDDLKDRLHPTYRTGYNAITKSYDAYDDFGHGTHVSGIIAASTNNNLGVAGISSTAQIIPCKFLNNVNEGYISDAIACIDFCHYTAGARISSHSWGITASSKTLSDKIKEVTNLGHLIIDAAGNSGTNNDINRNYPMYPASYSYAGIISVAAIDSTDVLAEYSNYGAVSVDLASPGSDIYSSHLGNGYSSWSGTSFSTPFVTGAAAALAAAKPGISAAEIKSTLLSSVRKLPSLTGKCVSEGALDLCAAVTAVMGSGSPGSTAYPPPPLPLQLQPPPPPASRKRTGRRLLDVYDDTESRYLHRWKLFGEPENVWEVIVTLKLDF